MIEFQYRRELGRKDPRIRSIAGFISLLGGSDEGDLNTSWYLLRSCWISSFSCKIMVIDGGALCCEHTKMRANSIALLITLWAYLQLSTKLFIYYVEWLLQIKYLLLSFWSWYVLLNASSKAFLSYWNDEAKGNFEPNWLGPYVVIEATRSGAYRLSSMDG